MLHKNFISFQTEIEPKTDDSDAVTYQLVYRQMRSRAPKKHFSDNELNKITVEVNRKRIQIQNIVQI